ncbi:MAG TPA: copper homeostasis protein CutC [Saprospiraceae bacterium]|nr:copper homeostasis protein CutC [Saprospiraceae bacterium]
MQTNKISSLSGIKTELCVAHKSVLDILEQFNFNSIELCVDLAVGGITPPTQMIQQFRANYKGELSVLIRSRAGDFCYNQQEKKELFEQTETALSHGADTIVIGALYPDKNIDRDFLDEFRALFPDCSVCFHRAFDSLPDPILGIKLLKNYNIKRVLTSGPNDIFGNSNYFNQIYRESNSEIEIMAGGGVRSEGLIEFLGKASIDRLHFSGTNKLKPQLLGPDPLIVKEILSSLSIYHKEL